MARPMINKLLDHMDTIQNVWLIGNILTRTKTGSVEAAQEANKKYYSEKMYSFKIT